MGDPCFHTERVGIIKTDEGKTVFPFHNLILTWRCKEEILSRYKKGDMLRDKIQLGKTFCLM